MTRSLSLAHSTECTWTGGARSISVDWRCAPPLSRCWRAPQEQRPPSSRQQDGAVSRTNRSSKPAQSSSSCTSTSSTGEAMRCPICRRGAFTVFEDDKPQDISFFEAGDVPVTVGLVIDNSTSMLTERELVVLAGTNAFAGSSHPEDRDVRDRLQRACPPRAARPRSVHDQPSATAWLPWRAFRREARRRSTTR